MSKAIEAEFYALAKFKQAVEDCAQVAYSIQKKAEDLELPQWAFTKVSNSKEISKVWKTVCEDRRKEAKALHDEFDAIATVMKSVAEMYGWTDADLAHLITSAAKLETTSGGQE